MNSRAQRFDLTRRIGIIGGIIGVIGIVGLMSIPMPAGFRLPRYLLVLSIVGVLYCFGFLFWASKRANRRRKELAQRRGNG